jgi:hypothetical protein
MASSDRRAIRTWRRWVIKVRMAAEDIRIIR